MTSEYSFLGEIEAFTPITPLEEQQQLIGDEVPQFRDNLVLRDVCLGSYMADHSPERSPSTVFSWDHTMDHKSPPLKRRKFNDEAESLGSHCSSPALSDVSENEFTPFVNEFSVNPTFDDLDDFDRMERLFSNCPSPPPPPATGTLPWENTWSPCPRKTPTRRNSGTNIWPKHKKWSQLNVTEQREAINSLLQITEDLGTREKLDIKHLLNINVNRDGPLVIDLNSLNDDKWRQIKLHIRKSISPVKQRPENTSPSLPVKRPACERIDVTTSPKKSTCNVPRKPANTFRVQTSGYSSINNKQQSKIKPRKQGVRRQYKTSENSLLRKDILNKITESASRGKVVMKLAVSDVREAVSGLFRAEEKIVLSCSTQEVDVDILG